MTPRKPVAFHLDEDDVAHVKQGESAPLGARVVIEEDAADTPLDLDLPAPVRSRRGIGWAGLLLSALGGLVSLAIGLSLDSLIRDLFSRNDWLGWLGLGLTMLALLASFVIITREVIGLMRVRKIDGLRSESERIAAADDGKAAPGFLKDLSALYDDRPELGVAKAAALSHAREIFDGRDLLLAAEADLLAPLDRQARRAVADTVKRVSVVTALSPRAVIDMLFVLTAILGLIRKLAGIYGGRPGFMGFLRLTRQVIAHLAITGGMAAGDSIVQQFLGHGLAARVSARLGEGMINGLLTARIGLAAVDVCRPMVFLGQPRPGLSEVMGGIMSPDKAGPSA